MAHNCPNCGAPIKHYYNHNCEYCGTFLHNTDEEVLKLDNCEIDLKDVYLKFNHIEGKYELTLIGISSPRFNYWEEGFTDLYVTTLQEPKRIGYKILIPLHLLNLNSKVDKTMAYIFGALPPVIRENQRNMNKIYECLYNHITHDNRF